MRIIALAMIVAQTARGDAIARDERAIDDLNDPAASARRAPIAARSGPQSAMRRARGLEKSWKFCAESRIKDLK